MTHEEANKILDAVRNGIPYPTAYVSKALHITGDLGAHALLRSKRVDQEVSAEDRGGRWASSEVLVGGCEA